MAFQDWTHRAIIGVNEGYRRDCWIVTTGTEICGDAIWIPKLLQPQAPQVGDTLSYIAIGSAVLACALGEKLLWDSRVTLTSPAS